MFHSKVTLCNFTRRLLRPVRALPLFLTEFLVYLGFFLNTQPLLFSADSLLGNKFPYSRAALAHCAARHSTPKLVDLCPQRVCSRLPVSSACISLPVCPGNRCCCPSSFPHWNKCNRTAIKTRHSCWFQIILNSKTRCPSWSRFH